jgi:hypothetical protein
MKSCRATNWFTVMVLLLCWLALTSCGAKADDKIKELQKQRLEAATKARNFLMNRARLPSRGLAQSAQCHPEIIA